MSSTYTVHGKNPKLHTRFTLSRSANPMSHTAQVLVAELKHFFAKQQHTFVAGTFDDAGSLCPVLISRSTSVTLEIPICPRNVNRICCDAKRMQVMSIEQPSLSSSKLAQREGKKRPTGGAIAANHQHQQKAPRGCQCVLSLFRKVCAS